MAEEPESTESQVPDAAAAAEPLPEVPEDLVPDVPEVQAVPQRPSPLLAAIVGGIALVLVVGAAYFGFRLLTGGASDAHARVEAAVSFTQAMLSQDTPGIKKHIQAKSLNRVTEAQWQALEQTAPKTSITFEKIKWSGEKATLDLIAEGQAGQITATADPRNTDTVTLSFSGKAFGETVPGSCVLVREGAAWKVDAFSIGTRTLKFDPADIAKTMGAK